MVQRLISPRIPDLSVLTVMFIMGAFGVLMVYDASAVSAALRAKFTTPYFFLIRQLTWFLIGSVIALTLSRINLKSLRPYFPFALGFLIVCLCLVFVPGLGVKVGGAQRWIRIGGFSIQPGEFLRIIYVLTAADLLARNRHKMDSFSKGFLPFAIITIIPIALLVMQPKIGSALIIAGLALILLYIANVRIRHLLISLIILSPALFFFISKLQYITHRIDAWLHPALYLRDAAFQTVQSLIAIGSGGIFGVGLGQGRQKMFYLPEAHTDLIFPVIAEELGFAGSLLLLTGFGFVLVRGIQTALAVSDPFIQLCAIGLTACILLPAIINLMVTTGLAPVTGIPLPLISFGGSALLTDMACLGILSNLRPPEPEVIS